MPGFILYHKPTDLYLEYSTVVDAPVTYSCTREQMRNHLLHRDGHGHDNGAWIDERLDRAVRKGSSDRDERATLETTISCNRAGKGETEMSPEQFIRHYFTERRGVLLPDERPVGDAPQDDEG